MQEVRVFQGERYVGQVHNQNSFYYKPESIVIAELYKVGDGDTQGKVKHFPLRMWNMLPKGDL
jgi:hypothetical protein